MPHNGYGLTTTTAPTWDRRHHTRYKTEPVENGRVVLVSNSPTNGRITLQLLDH